ncbi:putative receptor-like protein kinase At4g00960 [Neltuma alba]|uniref:putative receptor-like protein kinase At4g00960 n=1 Tax=Neltuma alba TaxID=207710 RepID=UPI0010A33669|nr:putative receptor-like protein kinase At4g00960 [Prosopis alba]
MAIGSLKIVSLLLISLLFSPTNEAHVTYLHHNCSPNITFAANSAFQSDRTTLFSSPAFVNTDFYNATVVGGGDTVHGLFMCRGDVNLAMCHQCVVHATQRLSSECRVSKEAIIWYDECLLRYSNRFFFSTIDTRPRLSLFDAGSVSNQASFMRTLYDTMNRTADEAAKPAVGKKKYATGAANFSSFQTVYCLAQCTPDLSPSDCRSCLSGVIGELKWCCSGKQGGRVLYPSCNVRYELHPFYQSEAAGVPPTNSTGSQGKGGISSGAIVAIVVPTSVAVLIFIVGICCLSKRAMEKYDSDAKGKSAIDIGKVDSLQYDFSTIEAATNKFSADNKLGEGGFGPVYKGTLANGLEIAVKRLSRESGQVVQEFKNEVEVVAKLQHRNLVRLLGFCVQGQENILVYEYFPNKSLDHILFEPEKQKQLDWTKRYKIVKGIAQGIKYLHEDSRLKIIHRDLKTSNILLDSDMNLKISDFGLARIFMVDQTHETINIAGTLGYISPEYAMHGQLSVKSDVFSFGVLLMEIISGRRNSPSYQMEGGEDLDLLIYAWKLWKDGEPLELLDPTIRESYAPDEVMRCIHIGLLCVQSDPAERPSMSSIVLMLENYPMTLPTPSLPAYFVQNGASRNILGQSTPNTLPMSVNEMSVSDECVGKLESWRF